VIAAAILGVTLPNALNTNDEMPPAPTVSASEDPVAVDEVEEAETEPAESSPSDADLEVVDAFVTYFPDQLGGNYHSVVVRVRNNSNEIAMGVGGQFSVKDENGKLVQAVDPSPHNILPGEEALFVEDALDFKKPVPNGKVEVFVTAERFQPGPESLPIEFRGLTYRRDSIGGCNIKGTLSNRFTEKKADLFLYVGGFNDGKLVTGGFTIVYKIFPKLDTTFEVTFFSPAQCPESLDEIRVFPDPDEYEYLF
jgi:hypothetical protein